MARSPGCAKRSRGGARGRLIATSLTLACLAANVAACGQTAPSQRRVSLLPYTAAKGESWDWSAACPYGPHAPGGCAPAGPVLGPAQLAGNEWNLGAGHGPSESVKMSLSPSGGLKVNANLTTAPPCTAGTCLTREANTWVRGYPSVLYGIDQCHAQTSPTPSPEFQLPARVDSIPADLVGRATYDAQGSQVTYDVPRALVGALNKDGLFFAWDRSNLAAGPVWQSTIADPSGSPRSIVSASWDGKYLYVGGGGAIINGASCYGNIDALDPASGAFVWRSCQTSFMTAALTEVPGLLIEGVGAGGQLKFLNTANGATVFTYNTGSTVQGEVTVSNGIVYVPLANGNLLALGQ